MTDLLILLVAALLFAGAATWLNIRSRDTWLKVLSITLTVGGFALATVALVRLAQTVL